MSKKWGRREFVKQSAAGILAVGWGPRPVMSKENNSAEITNGGLIGAGIKMIPDRMPYTSEKEGKLLVTGPLLPGYRTRIFTAEISFQRTVISANNSITPGTRSPVPFPLDSLPQGTSSITCRLLEGGKTVAAVAVDVIKLPPKPNEVKIDYISRGLIVDGLPYLPFGFYCWFPFGALADEEATQGFTHIAPYQSSSKGHSPEEMAQIRAYMDRCAAVGLKVHYDIRKIATLPASPQRDSLLQAEIEAFRDHPALLCWYAADEPNGNGISPAVLEESYRFIKQIDPYHPVTIVLDDPKAAPAYRRAMDIIMADPYPIPRSPVTTVSDWTDRLNRAVDEQMPLWIVPQAFGGGEWWQREPSAREERAMTYLALVHGAVGIQYFVRRAPIGNPKSPILWSECRRLALEAAELAPALLSPELRPAVSCSPNSVHAAAWQRQGKITLMVVNAQNMPGMMSVQLPGISYTGKAVLPFEGRQVDISNGIISEPIDAYGTRVYTIPVGPIPIEDLKIDPANLVINPSFEEMSDPGTPDGCYVSVGEDHAASLFVDSRIARHGRHSLRVTTPTEDQGLSIEPFPVPLKAGQSYRVSIWAVGKTEGLLLELSLGPVGTRQFHLTRDWQEYSFTGDSSKTISKASLSLRLVSAGTAWFDLLQIIPEGK